MASKRENIILQSTESHHRYTSSKNKTLTPGRLSLKKYDPTKRKRVEYKETK